MTYAIPTPEELQKELEPGFHAQIDVLVGRCIEELKKSGAKGALSCQVTVHDCDSHLIPYVQKRFAEHGWIVKRQSNQEETWLQITAAKKPDKEPFKTAMRDDAERLSS